MHAAVPGPQYETRAELRVLRALGWDSVSMSLAAETLAARDEGLRLAAVAVISNAGRRRTRRSWQAPPPPQRGSETP